MTVIDHVNSDQAVQPSSPNFAAAAATAAQRARRRGQLVDRQHLEPRRLGKAKPAYTTRFVAAMLKSDPRGYGLVSGPGVVPHAGDVVLARVEHLGQHLRIEGPTSRRAVLFEGDEILVAYGDRYAPDQFESVLPRGLERTHLVAAGGVAGHVVAAHLAMKDATEIQPLGLLSDARGVLTLRRCAPFAMTARARRGPQLARVGSPRVIGVLGTSMNSGKTTTVASIVRGLTGAGLEVAAGKVTGTGAGGDRWLFEDSGAVAVLDFTDFGFASTYRLRHEEICSLFGSVIDALAANRPDVIVIEVADGLFQPETANLVNDPMFSRYVHKIVFAAGEAVAAKGGHDLLAAKGLAPVVISGRLTASPLATREAAAALDVPILDSHELSSSGVAEILLPRFHRGVRSTGVETGAGAVG